MDRDLEPLDREGESGGNWGNSSAGWGGRLVGLGERLSGNGGTLPPIGETAPRFGHRVDPLGEVSRRLGAFPGPVGAEASEDGGKVPELRGEPPRVGGIDPAALRKVSAILNETTQESSSSMANRPSDLRARLVRAIEADLIGPFDPETGEEVLRLPLRRRILLRTVQPLPRPVVPALGHAEGLAFFGGRASLPGMLSAVSMDQARLRSPGRGTGCPPRVSFTGSLQPSPGCGRGPA